MIGVALPVYHQERAYIDECIDSLEAQTYRDFELVIVLDGANEGTVQAVVDAVRRLTVPYRILYRADNRGIARSLNEGFLRLEHCDWLTWVSSDNRYEPNFLETLRAAIDAEPEQTVLAYSLFHAIDEQGRRLEDEASRRARMTVAMDRPKEDIFRTCFIGASFLFRRDAYVSVGGFNPDYEKVEDYEFWMRLLQVGDIRFVPEFLMEYRIGGRYAYSTTTPREHILWKSAKAAMDNRVKRGDVPAVTVVVCAHNQERYIARAIESVLTQTYEALHLLVVDDGSTDGTWDAIHRQTDPRIVALRLANRGKAKALNAALELAAGKYVLELDADDWLEPNALEIMIDRMEREPESTALAYANRRIWFDRDGALEEGPVYTGMDYGDKYEVLAAVKTHCPRLYRTQALRDVGGWPTKWFAERLLVDDFAIMALLAERYKFLWIDETLYNQRRHEGNITDLRADECRRQLEHIVVRTLRKWNPELRATFEPESGWIERVVMQRAPRRPHGGRSAPRRDARLRPSPPKRPLPRSGAKAGARTTRLAGVGSAKLRKPGQR